MNNMYICEYIYMGVS